MLKPQPKKHLPRLEGGSALRITEKKIRTNKKILHLPSFVIKCGCCEQKVEIFYDHDSREESLEIGGVDGSLKNWREILLPLLKVNVEDGIFIDNSNSAQEARKTLAELREKYGM